MAGRFDVGMRVDFLGLVIHVSSGLVGGYLVSGLRSHDGSNLGGVALAAAMGGLLGAQIIERSVGAGFESAATGGASIDAGAAIVAMLGAGAGGAVLTMLLGRIGRHFGRG